MAFLNSFALNKMVEHAVLTKVSVDSCYCPRMTQRSASVSSIQDFDFEEKRRVTCSHSCSSESGQVQKAFNQQNAEMARLRQDQILLLGSLETERSRRHIGGDFAGACGSHQPSGAFAGRF